MNNKYWYEVYEDIAKEIKEWAENEIRKYVPDFSNFSIDKIENIEDEVWDNLARNLYQTCIDTAGFSESNNWFDKFDSTTQKLDPLHLFASFNAVNISIDLRQERISSIYRALGVINVIQDSVDYSGCPTPVVIHSLAVRNNEDICSIWKCFFASFYYRQNGLKSMVPIFDNSLRVSGVGMASLTIFLFWINPRWFMPLDQSTTHWLKNAKVMEREPLNFTEYCKILNVDSATLAYIEIARLAYHKRKQIITATDDYSNELLLYLQNKLSSHDMLQIYNGTEVEINNSVDFKIIALKILPECNVKYSKSLTTNELLILNNKFIFNDGNKSIFYEQNNLSDNFYSGSEKLNIMVNAIVGKNGTGKSTIIELILASFYHLNALINNISSNINEIYVELFIYANLHIYQFILKDDDIAIINYDYSDGNKFIRDDIGNQDKLNYEHKDVISSAYFLCLNYSQFGFNSSQIGMEWVEDLFHRNDTYQLPILIEPKREQGNIDINLQAGLAKNRLLTNLFNYNDALDDAAAKDNFKISEFSYVEKLVFSIDENKLKKYQISNKNYDTKKIKFIDELMRNLFLDDPIYDIQNLTTEKLLVLNYAKQYLYAKLINSAVINDRNDLDACCENLTNDLSFRTRKIWNAINFIRFFNEYTKFVIDGEPVDILEISKFIFKLKSNYDASELSYKDNISIEHFIPPSFFYVEIILSNNIPFDSLSSGEKQLIFSVNTVLYHLRNLESLSRNNIGTLRKYNYINVFFDEIELYFHPELQRKYINDLIDNCMSKLYSEILWGVNFTFVTHSPFILSDIHTSQILFLDRDQNVSFPKNVNAKVLGANIHDLLINGMFLENLTGEFVYNKVKNFLSFFNKVMNSTDEQKPDLKTKFTEQKKEFEFLAENIGEAVIANMIKNNIEMIENKLFETNAIIKELERKIELLKLK